MLFRLLKPLRSQAVILALGTAWVLVQPAGWPMAAGIPNVPTHYIYGGQNVPLPVDLGRVAIEYKPGASSANLISSLKGWGIEVASEISTGVENRHHFELQTVRQDAAEMYALVEQLAESPDVAFASPVFHGTGEEWFVITPEILARFTEDYESEADFLIAQAAPELEVVRRNFGDMPGAFILRSSLKNGFEVLAQANALAGDARIKWAEPNAHISGRGSLIPDDPGFPDCWGLRNTGQLGGTPGMDMKADLAWDITIGSPCIKVLVIEVGVDQDHEDINQLPGADFTGQGGGGGPVNSSDNHGTPVAGCISATINNNRGTVGTAPGCKVLSARTFIATGGTGWSADFSWTVDALAWAESQGVRVTNNSNGYGGGSSAVTDKYAATYANGMVHFASAMNDAQPTVGYPASLPTVNAISAMAPSGALASFSNYGPDISLAAPGEDIYTTDRTGAAGWDSGDYTYASGTSFASPYTAGVAALVLSLAPGLTAPEVEDMLRATATDLGTPGFDEDYGYGLVNAFEAVKAADTSSAVDTSTTTDTDGDGTADLCDNCPLAYNPDQEDADADGFGDACDVCPVDPLNDADGDGSCADVDNCPFISNPTQDDGNANGIGDACECVNPNNTFTGSGYGFRLGKQVASAGDVNNDGYDDIIVGRDGAQSTAVDPGNAYVYSGLDGSLLYTFTGEAAKDWFGYSVAGAGDVNGDGFADMLVGAIGNDAGSPIAGRAYVFLGGGGPFPASVAAADAHHKFTGLGLGDRLGSAVAGIGDVDGDSIPDLLVGGVQYTTVPGLANLYSGSSGSLIQGFIGEAAGDFFGTAVAALGDVNNDGIPDFGIGAPGNDGGGGAAGRVYIYSGATLAIIHTLSGTAGETMGQAVAGAGDVDDDGFDDVLVGAPYNSVSGYASGRVFVYSGQSGDTIRSHGGAVPDDMMGSAADGVGDVDDDGFDDYAIAATGAGVVYVYSGQTGNLMARYLGETGSDAFGSGVSGSGDANGDGVNDLIVGAPWNDVGGNNAGRAYTFYLGDADGDIFTAGCDNCPQVYNPGQVDNDENGIGDVCECACVCHGDPECDTTTNVFDIVHAVTVGFRNAPDVVDPNPSCARTTTDVDCDGDTDVLDVVRFVNVAFRDGAIVDNFCDPCAP